MTEKAETIVVTLPAGMLPGSGWKVLAWAGPSDPGWWWKISDVLAWRIREAELEPLAPGVPAEALADRSRWVALPSGTKADDTVISPLGPFDSFRELITEAREAWEEATGRQALEYDPEVKA
ncbi:MAG: hypothetical protein AB7I59_05470 [Geminicoccaceae bacterium]